MENQIVSSQFKSLGTHFSNGGINLDLGSLLISIALIFVGTAIYSYVRYKRDKEGIPDKQAVENLKSDVDYLIRKYNALDDRILYVEEKNESISTLHKSINELKNLIKKELKSEK